MVQLKVWLDMAPVAHQPVCLGILPGEQGAVPTRASPHIAFNLTQEQESVPSRSCHWQGSPNITQRDEGTAMWRHQGRWLMSCISLMVALVLLKCVCQHFVRLMLVE